MRTTLLPLLAALSLTGCSQRNPDIGKYQIVTGPTPRDTYVLNTVDGSLRRYRFEEEPAGMVEVKGVPDQVSTSTPSQAPTTSLPATKPDIWDQAAQGNPASTSDE